MTDAGPDTGRGATVRETTAEDVPEISRVARRSWTAAYCGFLDGVGHRAVLEPDRWGEGTGTRLFERLLAALGERGAERIGIRVLAATGVGRSFHESRGFDAARGDLVGSPASR